MKNKEKRVVRYMFIPENLINEHFDDRYFDVVNALDEARQIYFKNNNIFERIVKARELEMPFIIGELGFGAGRIVVSLMEFIGESGLKDVDIEYYSVELYPLSSERICSILDGFKSRVGREIKALVKEYEKIDRKVPGWHSMKIGQPFGSLKLKLWIGEALEMVSALEKPCDVWFLDGHGPKKNPSMWRPELLMAIGEKTKTGGSCSTFTVAVAVQKALKEAGFSVEKLPGCGGKKENLYALKK
jgi:tRNA 5-methylaminomethyl-2-thiouridine biosynthesis bifunctional protein